MSKPSTCFRVTYRDPKDGQLTSLTVRTIDDSSLGLSFVALSDFVFETSTILVDPKMESKKLEFEDIKVLHLSIYSIVSIAEVGEHKKPLSFKHDKANLLLLKPEDPGRPSN